MAADDVDFAGKGQKKGFGQKVRSCCNSIYDSKEGKFLGRTKGSWAKITVFYIIFYSCLAGFFAIMMVGFFATLDDTAPTMQKMYSLIKQNPGMGFRPMVSPDSTLIKFNASERSTYMDDIDNIIIYLSKNYYLDENNRTTNVTHSEGKELFDINTVLKDGCEYYPDNKYDSFGYKDGKPCVLLKINRVFDWTPENFDNDSLSTDFGKEAIASQDGKMPLPGYIAVSCEGENDGDIDNLGKASFVPKEGFSFGYYPYLNEKLYRAPIVFAKFPNVNRGVVMQVWCKLWVKNIKHHKNDKAGSVHFELLVDQIPDDPNNTPQADGSQSGGSNVDGSR